MIMMNKWVIYAVLILLLVSVLYFSYPSFEKIDMNYVMSHFYTTTQTDFYCLTLNDCRSYSNINIEYNVINDIKVSQPLEIGESVSVQKIIKE